MWGVNHLRAGAVAVVVAVSLTLVLTSGSGAQAPRLPVSVPIVSAPGVPVVNPAVAPDRSVEPVVLTGADFPGWAAPANQTAKLPLTDFKDCPPGSNTDNCQHNRYVQPEVNAQLPIQGTPTDRLLGYRWDGRRFVQIPFQVDKMFTRYLENDASGFAIYSGADQHTTYEYSREGFRYTRSDPHNPCLARPDSPTAKDPVRGLDTNDELAFMASDAGSQAPANSPLPRGVVGVRAVTINDPYAPGHPSYVYVMKAGAKGPRPAYNASNGYVSYMRDPNADFFELSQSDYSNYGNAAKGIVCDAQGHIIRDSHGNPVIARRRPRDYATVTTSRYKFRYDGRWLMTGINISPDGGRSFGPNLVDRWKARAFAQDPSSKTPCCGFEEEDTHWGGSSTLLGEKVGPVRAIRETWGADSGTNVIRRETFYRDQVRMKSWLRVHPIPPLDGIYAQWDFAAGRMTRFYNPNVPNGVPVDGRNDTVFGNLDDPCNDNYDSNQLGTGVGGIDPNQTYRQFYRQAMVCKVSPYHQSINVSDPTFEAANAGLSWAETTGPWGTIVDRTQIDQATDLTPGGAAQDVAAVPYYRDDSCFDDGTGNDPGPRLNPGKSDEPRTAGGVPRKCWTPADGIPQPGDSHFYQGDIGTHGLHILFILESDNARQTVPLDEIVSETRLVMLPGQQGDVGEQYGREFEKPLVTTVGSYSSSSQEVDGGGPATTSASARVSPSNPLGLPANRSCKAPAGFRLPLHQPRGQRLVKVTVFADGARVASRRGRRVTSVVIPHLLQANEVIKVVAITSKGRRIVTARVYRGCLPPKPRHHRRRR
jgi:hypothetical protein